MGGGAPRSLAVLRRELGSSERFSQRQEVEIMPAMPATSSCRVSCFMFRGERCVFRGLDRTESDRRDVM
jgi:hypothetical protein